MTNDQRSSNGSHTFRKQSFSIRFQLPLVILRYVNARPIPNTSKNVKVPTDIIARLIGKITRLDLLSLNYTDDVHMSAALVWFPYCSYNT